MPEIRNTLGFQKGPSRGLKRWEATVNKPGQRGAAGGQRGAGGGQGTDCRASNCGLVNGRAMSHSICRSTSLFKSRIIVPCRKRREETGMGGKVGRWEGGGQIEIEEGWLDLPPRTDSCAGSREDTVSRVDVATNQDGFFFGIRWSLYVPRFWSGPPPRPSCPVRRAHCRQSAKTATPRARFCA